MAKFLSAPYKNHFNIHLSSYLLTQKILQLLFQTRREETFLTRFFVKIIRFQINVIKERFYFRIITDCSAQLQKQQLEIDLSMCIHTYRILNKGRKQPKLTGIIERERSESLEHSV